MATTNYSTPHMPMIARNIGGANPSERSTLLLPGKSSAAIYLGSFIPFVKGTDAAPTGVEFGVEAFADDGIIGGFVVGFRRGIGGAPIWDDANRSGTVTNATGELPLKYTFSATNDQASTTAANLEMVEILPITNMDILELALWGAGAVSVARGTTTAAGTTGSSANIGVGMSLTTTYPFALLESTASNTLANLDFMTTLVDGKQPANPNHVYVMPIRSFSAFRNVQ